jgi:hypothetical protein
MLRAIMNAVAGSRKAADATSCDVLLAVFAADLLRADNWAAEDALDEGALACPRGLPAIFSPIGNTLLGPGSTRQAKTN